MKDNLITFMGKIVINVFAGKVWSHSSPKFGYHQNLKNELLKQDKILFSFNINSKREYEDVDLVAMNWKLFS